MRWDAEIYGTTDWPQTDAGRKLIRMASVKTDDSVLDIGCGTGRLTSELARLAHTGRVVGIDPSAEMLGKARKVAASAQNMTLIQMPAQGMDFREEFTAVYSNSAFQWIREQEEVLDLSYRALKNKGRIAIQLSAPDFCWAMTENIQSAISALKLESTFSRMEPPWRFPLAKEMEASLEDAGFRNVRAEYVEDLILFDDVNEVLAWGVAAGLRPFLDPLNESSRERFKYAFAMGFENYRTGKGIEFSFRRLFALAEKTVEGQSENQASSCLSGRLRQLDSSCKRK